MKKRFGAFALSMIMLLSCAFPASAAQLGPASSYSELLALAERASSGDTLLISGDIWAGFDQPLSSQAQLFLRGANNSSISALSLHDANIVVSNLTIDGGLRISGASYVQLERGVTVRGADDSSYATCLKAVLEVLFKQLVRCGDSDRAKLM